MGKAPGFHAGLRFAKDPAQEVGGLPCACRSCRAALLAASSRHAALLATRSRRAALLATPLAPSLAGRLKNRARCRIWRIAVWGIPRVAAKLGREALLARGRLTKPQFRHREKPQFRRRPCNARAFPNAGTPKLATRPILQTRADQIPQRAGFSKRRVHWGIRRRRARRCDRTFFSPASVLGRTVAWAQASGGPPPVVATALLLATAR